MDESQPPLPSSIETELAHQAPAIYVNRFLVTTEPHVLRIAFGDFIGPDTGAKYRTSVAMSYPNAQELVSLLQSMIAYAQPVVEQPQSPPPNRWLNLLNPAQHRWGPPRKWLRAAKRLICRRVALAAARLRVRHPIELTAPPQMNCCVMTYQTKNWRCYLT